MSSHAGLDFSSSQLSLPLSISGVALMVWSLVFFPVVQRCLGARACAVLGLGATVFLSVALGCTSYLAQVNLWLEIDLETGIQTSQCHISKMPAPHA